jgi:hypothetical protein
MQAIKQQSIPALFDCVSAYFLTRLTVWAKKGVRYGIETNRWQRMQYSHCSPWHDRAKGAAIWTNLSVKHTEEIKVMQPPFKALLC